MSELCLNFLVKTSTKTKLFKNSFRDSTTGFKHLFSQILTDFA